MIGLLDFKHELASLLVKHNIHYELRIPEEIVVNHLIETLNTLELTMYLKDKTYGRLPIDAVPPKREK